MISVRTKLTLLLLTTSFAAIATVGITARWITLASFNDAVVSHASQGFESEVIDYYEAYGSWESARNSENFHDFALRTRPGLAQRRPPPAAGIKRPPPPLDGAKMQRPPNRPFGLGGSPPPFLLADETGTVLLNLAGRKVGDQLSANELKRSRPINHQDSVIALVFALKRPMLTEIEQRYLASIEDAWFYSLLIAMVLAIPVGLVLGNLFSVPIKDLRRAIMAMEGGQLRQLVRVRSKDEIGQLSTAFNQMSKNLSTAHEELEASRTRLGQQAEALEALSRRDELTQLFNRRAFDELVSSLFAQARRFNHPLTLAMIDIDFFKKVNDAHSHAIGDRVLHEVAQLLSTSLRKIDLVARYGGEEFVIAFSQTNIVGATQFSDRLRQRVAAHDWAKFAPALTITISIGLAERSTEELFQELLSKADAKLYQAKEEGRNRVCS
jgi:two-component system, cell cycle response regulator